MSRGLHQLGVLLLATLSANQLYAEGMLDMQPYVRAGILYDDNLFRFASKTEAQSAGFSNMSDSVKTLDVGVQTNLRLSRQLFRVNASINENQYNQYTFLDNTGKAYGLSWNWQLGDDIYGDLSTSRTQSIAGFSDNDIVLRNLRTFKRQRASANWNLLSSVTLYGTKENSVLDNEELTFEGLDREDDSYEVGTRYQSTSGTQVGLFYRYLESDYLNRTGATALIFGRKNEQKQYGLNLVWLPTLKTRLSGQVSHIAFTREEAIQEDFNGINHRWNVDYTLSAKTTLGMTAYRELASVDDLLSTYVLFKGASANVGWNITSKLNMNGSYGVGKREFLGGSSIFSAVVAREDNTKRFAWNLDYQPTAHALLQLRFVDEDRASNISRQAYRFQSINFTGQYNF